MIGLTCGKCERRFTSTDQDVDGYLAESTGRKYALVLCPHCGYGNKIAVRRLQQTVHRIGGQQSKE